MALVGPELIVVVAILAILFLWGPKKLPELARSIGLAKKEFEKAGQPSSPVTSDDPLITAAKNLGIETEGKTKDEIAKEIAKRTSESKSNVP